MKNAYIVTGTLKGNQTLVLDEPLDMYDWKVRVIVEPLEALPRQHSHKEVMEKIWREQDERGYVRRTKEEIDEYLREIKGYGSE
ncbi:MAG: hypothetical protein OXI16_00205 [Chloroflexota bacterium]|nr:hypothetical protein [Chloroflexota bacterium]MDE2685910.1 hypothetical protein [Chloroflexota bacterium]